MVEAARRANDQAPNIRIRGLKRVGKELLGSGGFSWVLLYEHRTMGAPRAVKILRDKVKFSRRAAYRDESSTLAGLNHRYIARVIDSGFGAGHPYIVMDYYPDTLRAKRNVSVVEAVELGVKLASAVAYLHRKGVIHCDIKPANIMLSDGDPHLTDFGAAVQFSGDPSNTTVPAPVPLRDVNGAHSPLWAAREQFFENAIVSPATDVFGLAATVYWLLEGRSPYQAAGEENARPALPVRGRDGTIFPIQRDIPPQLRAALERALRPQLDVRTQTASEFGSQLSAVLATLGAPPHDLPDDVVDDLDATVTDFVTADQSPADLTETIRGVPRRVSALTASPVTETGFEIESTRLPADRQELDREDSGYWKDLHGDDTDAGPVEGADTAYREPSRSKPAQTPHLTSRTLIIAAASVVLVSGVAVGAAVLTQAPTEGGTPDATVVSTPTSLGEGPIPTPELVSATQDPATGTVTFVWSNPAGESGDTYIWKRTDGPNDSPQYPTDEPTAQIAEVPADDSVCVAVVVRRQGRTSATPLETCFPQ